MSVDIKKKGKKLLPRSMELLERKLNGKLPKDFRDFLIESNGGEPEVNEFTLPESNLSSGVNQFLSVEEILEKKDLLKDRLLENAWPIGFAEGGNYICLVTGKDSGVYFWDHEYEAEEGDPATQRNIVKISDTFSGFLALLKKFDINQVELKPGQVKKTWIDPDFKPEF